MVALADFQNLRGYFGVDYPTQNSWGASTGAPMSPFILLRSEEQGLYAGVTAPSSELVAWHTELRRATAVDRPRAAQAHHRRQRVAIRFAAVHVPYIQPGETRTLTPIALEAFRGLAAGRGHLQGLARPG